MMKIENLEHRIYDHVSGMLGYWDKDQVCRFANAAYVDWFGITKEEIIGKMTVKELLGPIYELNLPYVLAALKGKIQIFEREFPIPGGGSRHSLVKYYPDIIDGEVMGFVTHAVDVTHLKLVELELKKSNEVINKQNQRLLSFTNIVSHNLKTHANNLAGILELIEATDDQQEKDTLFAYLKDISTCFSETITNLNEIVQTHNDDNIPLEPVNLCEFVQKALNILKIEIETQKVLIENNICPNVMLMVNPSYMESILLNLLSNAIKYKDPNRNPEIKLSFSADKKENILEVKDNGSGIDLEKYGNKLFSMYQTFHGNPDAQGIGLFITKSQIESMGGAIAVESAVNVGTTFKITLPNE